MQNTTIHLFFSAGLTAALTTLAGGAMAHDDGSVAGGPVCLEANFMLADAQFAPDSSAPGPGRVVEMNIITGERGITVNNPFGPGNAGTAICPEGVVCGGPWKPTGVLSGGLNGHAFITSAAQHALTEFHRDGTPIRTVSYNDIIGTETGAFGTVPRPLGTQMMPNGNIIQAICDANFNQIPPAGGGASNSDPNPGFFPPVWTSAERAANSRLLVLDQESLKVIDEYRAPDDPRWTCMAGIAFDSEGMYVSMFHGAAIFVIDWKAGLSGTSSGVGSNDPGSFKLDRRSNQAEVIRVIDLLGPGAADDDPNRRDSLRAVSLDEAGNVYVTNRRRSQGCEANEPGCNPGVFRHRVDIVPAGENYPTATLALDPGINIIAGIRVNRMSAVGCDAINPVDPVTGLRPDPDACDVETLYVAASAMNPGCDPDGDGINGPGHPANQCFVRGGYVAEYLIDADHLDGVNGSCTGNPADGFGAGQGNAGCAQPIATFFGAGNGEDNLDPRMLMPIHEAFIQ